MEIWGSGHQFRALCMLCAHHHSDLPTSPVHLRLCPKQPSLALNVPSCLPPELRSQMCAMPGVEFLFSQQGIHRKVLPGKRIHVYTHSCRAALDLLSSTGYACWGGLSVYLVSMPPALLPGNPMLLASSLLWLEAAEPELASLVAGWCRENVKQSDRSRAALTGFPPQHQEREALLFGSE